MWNFRREIMSTYEIISICLGGGGLLGIFGLAFAFGRMFQRIDSIGKDIIEIKTDIKSLNQKMGFVEVQLGKLETRVEERTLRVIHGTKVEGEK